MTAVQDLVRNRLSPSSIGILAKQRLLSRELRRLPVVGGDAATPAEFDLLASHEDKILCFGRTLGSFLRDRVSEGSETLSDALQPSLLPRHACALSGVVEKDGILIWVEVHDPAEEREASLSLLRTSSGTVESHDFSTAT